MSDVTLDFTHRSKAFEGTPLADLLLDAGFAPLESSHDKNPAVEAMQAALQKLGYDCQPDGQFGPHTLSVLKKFQKDVVDKVNGRQFGAGFLNEGSADWLTLLALDAACAAKEGGLGGGGEPAAPGLAKPGTAGPKPAGPNGAGGPAQAGGGPAPAQAGGDPAPAAGPADPQPKSTVRPGYDLLPRDMKNRYLKMSFTVDGNQIDIDLPHLKYHNLSIHNAHKAKGQLDDPPIFNESCKNFLSDIICNELQKKEMAWLEENIGPKLAKGAPAFLMRAFIGKGSPDDIQAVLKIAAKLGKRLRQDWRDQGSLSATLADFYKRNMGLDCNGFAGNYAKAIGHPTFYGETFIPHFAPPARRRRSLDEILPGDVIVWDPKHIATIQGRRDDGDFDIVESSGEPDVQGLGDSVRRLSHHGGDSFKVLKVYPDGPRSTVGEPVFVATLL